MPGFWRYLDFVSGVLFWMGCWDLHVEEWDGLVGERGWRDDVDIFGSTFA